MLPHELIPWLLRDRSRKEIDEIVGTAEEIREYWKRTENEAWHPGRILAKEDVDDCIPLGLHGDEFRFTTVSNEKLLAITLNFPLGERKLRFPLFLQRCDPRLE